jgi:IMP cyclohydrolase
MIRGLENLSAMRYPGRGIILGRDLSGGRHVVVYFITGRSASSQARKLVWESPTLWTRPTDEATLKKGQVDLLIYPAVIIGEAGLAVSNGKQTADIAKAARPESSPAKNLEDGLRSWSFEPDAPIHTPRISGWLAADGRAALHIVKRAPNGSEERCLFSLPVLRKGSGLLITTYAGRDGTLLPCFQGGPKRVCLTRARSAKEQAEGVYAALRPPRGKKDYRVTVACMFLESRASRAAEVHIINRSEGMES